ncbi:ABC transporter substrate-binding protein [Mesorhizobium sp. B4-1-4]|uniref:ABC transporter substrate-binding protein n=1 Tax=Mesorhizobium sp. B4-1-4 TaxID=2589888 RepID=UPI001D00D574|nr:ABC transporter substrate-binding protein [Mesorhizobium sp. B4-1-4]UCI31933.1 ABC transporter substrate-binding protein [Mesorhizobium sp. B4-1-4]
MVSETSKFNQFSKGPTRRRVLKGGLAIGGGAALGTILGPEALLSSARAESKTLTLESGTGMYADCLRTSFFEPFEKEAGIKILTSPENADNSKFKLAVTTRHYTSDVMDVSSAFAQPPNGEKYLEPIDYSVINKADLIPDLAQTYAVALDDFAYTLGYNSEKTGGKIPTGWDDFFDLEKFPGKRGVGDSPNTILIMALLADGVAPKDIVPLDFDRAFKKLNTIRKDLVFWETGAQVQDLLISGETPLTMMYANRVASAHADGKPVGQVWNGFLVASDMRAVAKGNPNKDLAMKYLAFVLSKKNQRDADKLHRPRPREHPCGDQPEMGRRVSLRSFGQAARAAR